jgi:transcriptional regulator with XRE-family HTH domain
MNFQAMGDAAVLREIGERLKQTRLQRNMTQASLSDLTGVSRRTIQKTEEGDVSTLKTLIALLRGLGLLDQLNLLLPEAPLSPIQLAKLRGKVRRRASGAGRKPHSPKDPKSPLHVNEPKADWQWDE